MAGRSIAACVPTRCSSRLENSLRRLGTDYIDLYQTHWPSAPPDFTPVAETMACLLKLKDQGKVRAIGVCNVSLGELQENLRCGAVVSDQFRYSMLWREPESDILPFCAKHHLGALTYMSTEAGIANRPRRPGSGFPAGRVPQ